MNVRQSHFTDSCAFRTVPRVMDPAAIIEALKRHGVTHERIADAIGRDRTVATKLLGGTRSMKTSEVGPLQALVADAEAARGDLGEREPREAGENRFDATLVGDYVGVEVLPTYAGMGGGGTGEGDRSQALLPRSLVRDELRAEPGDLLVINVRGDSMTPMFEHGDQLVIDKRDTNPVQPGPFALWDGDGYVVKNVERIRATKRYRIFSTNPAYSAEEASPEEISIMGRPVWFARRM